ncbi:VOC family protein [Massilia agilis]|uniref:VOC family protein n=1 Tax=Massilia agilis TaxID=1811226 RepID=A0ABT2DIK9_9BURK|nr:VOC family protein [Massilia agilis]MCS0810303.1 VOC family protein [Massilia agilis]
MMQPIPYLVFNGNCAEAMRFYERVLDGKIETTIRMADMPCPSGTPAGQGDLIAHIRLALDKNGNMLFAGDCPPSMPYEGIKGVSFTLSYDTVEQAQRIFADLSEGGQITMPFAPAFWAQGSGMVTDRFGVPWIVNGALIQH